MLRRKPAEPLMFHDLARFYDALYSVKDYASEARYLESLVRRYSSRPTRTWIDVACGTGRHLGFLQRTHAVTGVDASGEMLKIARERLPDVRLVRADMRTFRLDDRFDVLSCLFSAIGHLRSERDLATSFRNFARHLKVGGVAVIEPWIDPAGFRRGHVNLTTYQSPSLAIARMSVSGRRGSRSVVHYHYMIAERGRPLRRVDEVGHGLLVSRTRLVSLLEQAGFNARFLENGLPTGRGLLVGVKRARAPCARSVRRPAPTR